MKAVVASTISLFVVALLVLAWPVLEGISTLFLNARIERLGRTGFPNAEVESGGIVHCRMQADDFRFPLPPGSHAHDLRLDSGGFDTVNGWVAVTFDHPCHMQEAAYRVWLAGRLPVGGACDVQTTPDGMVLTFRYFGDR